MSASNTTPYISVVQLALQIYHSIGGTSTSEQERRAQTSEILQPHQLYTPTNVTSFLTTPWMVQEVYTYLPMLRDVLAWQNSSPWTRPIGQSFVSQRFTCILRPFVGDHVPALCFLMYAWGVVITGSCALEMLTGQHHQTDNLNLVVPQGSFNTSQEFIIESLKYRRVDAVTRPHYAFGKVVQTYAKYRRGNLRITLAEANTDDVFDVITSSPTTGDMVFMTSGGVAAFYADLTFKGAVIRNSSLKKRPPGANYVGCMKHARYTVYDSTHFLQQPCGHVCPAVWRNIVDGGPGALVLEWDSRYSIKSILARSHTSWRLAEHCDNVLCPLNPVINVRLPRLPTQPAPADQRAMREQEARMRHYHSDGMCSYIGILYATRACAPELVPIPLRNGLNQLKHINDLEVLHWVNCLGDNKFNVDMARVRKTYNVTAQPSSPAYGHGYTFFREHPALFAPPNALIAAITADNRVGTAVTGNVLVVKHINGNKHDIVDLSTADLDCINDVLNRCAEFWT